MTGLIGLDKANLLRTAPRLLQILRVLAKHGFLGALRGLRHWPSPQQVRETFEELGLAYLKLGQVLAMRRDMLPDDYANELEQLHDQLPALPFATIRRLIECNLRAPLDRLFLWIGEEPLAAATIAQVHKAILPDGRHVVVKVQRPGLEELINTDITALQALVRLVEHYFPRLRSLDLPVFVAEFHSSLKKETDFQREARSISRFRSSLEDVEEVWIPDVVPEYTCDQVLTMEFAQGERVDTFARQQPEAVSRSIGILLRLMLRTIFEEGLFHADPHCGNVMVMEDGRLCLVDFGMMGELDEAMRESLTYLLDAVVSKDARAATDAYLEMAMASEKANRAALMVDMKAVLQEIHRRDLAEVSLGETFGSMVRAGSRHGVHNPGEFFYLTRAFLLMESMMRQLDPHFNFMDVFREEVTRLIIRHWSLTRIKEKTKKLGRELERLMSDGPGDVRRVLRRVAEGNLGQFQAPALEALGGRISRNLKRLTGAIIAGALVVGGAMLVASRYGGWHGLLGEAMVTGGVLGALMISLGLFRRERGRGRTRG